MQNFTNPGGFRPGGGKWSGTENRHWQEFISPRPASYEKERRPKPSRHPKFRKWDEFIAPRPASHKKDDYSRRQRRERRRRMPSYNQVVNSIVCEVMHRLKGKRRIPKAALEQILRDALNRYGKALRELDEYDDQWPCEYGP